MHWVQIQLQFPYLNTQTYNSNLTYECLVKFEYLTQNNLAQNMHLSPLIKGVLKSWVEKVNEMEGKKEGKKKNSHIFSELKLKKVRRSE